MKTIASKRHLQRSTNGIILTANNLRDFFMCKLAVYKVKGYVNMSKKMMHSIVPKNSQNKKN